MIYLNLPRNPKEVMYHLFSLDLSGNLIWDLFCVAHTQAREKPAQPKEEGSRAGGRSRRRRGDSSASRKLFDDLLVLMVVVFV